MGVDGQGASSNDGKDIKHDIVIIVIAPMYNFIVKQLIVILLDTLNPINTQFPRLKS